MGNCTATRMGWAASGEEEPVVALCRQRKRLIKLAVDRRYALADAHCRYLHSLNSVAAALHFFVARHSAPAAPFLITLPTPSDAEDATSPPLPQRLTPPLSVGAPSAARSSTSSESSSCSRSSGEELCRGAGEGAPPGSPYFHSEVPAAEQQQGEMMGWDFFSFNPFCGVVTGSDGRSWDEELRAVRQPGGIPELEEEEKDVVGQQVKVKEKEHYLQGDEGECREMVGGGKEEGSHAEEGEKGLSVMETAGSERELLEALRDVEDHFLRAHDSGREVSRMLEANRFPLQSGLEEIKENSSKIINAITWHRTPSQSSSFRSNLGSNSRGSSSSWTHYDNELFDDYGGMESGSHSLTLERLYEWEKKLYDEVKAGDQTRQMYERKVELLRKKDSQRDDLGSVDKTRNAVKDLYTRIWVALRTVESISNRIQKLRDEELQPQLVELLKGLMTTWRVMLESHETQNRVMFEVKTFTSSAYGRHCGNPHRHATLQLETEIQNWRTCFVNYVSSQRAYVEALSSWLSKFIAPEVNYYPRGRSSAPYHVGAPPLVVICHDWLASLQKLPDSSVAQSMKNFTRDVRALWVQQGGEQQQKRKVDSLAKELDRRVVAFQKTENRILETKFADKTEPDVVRQRVDYLSGGKNLLDMCRSRLDIEKTKHHDCMQETQRIILGAFQTGFTSVFESLTEFSKASLNSYTELVAYSEKANFMQENPSCIEGGSQAEVDSG